MEIKSLKSRQNINQWLILLSGVLFIASAVLIYILILSGVYGKFSAKELVPKPEFVINFFSGEKPTVAILDSKYTQNMLPEGSTWLKDNINTWEKFLSQDGYKYKVISDQDIETGQHFKYKIIVLPGSKSLSEKENIQIKKFIIQGGSVFATSGTATFSDNGEWRGWHFFSQVYGLKFSKEIDQSKEPKVHTLRGGLPITANIPSGYPLKIATWDRPISVEVLDPRTTQVSFWYDFREQDGLTRKKIKKSAGIVYGTYGYGRFVWMGFELNSVVGVQEDYIYFDRLFRNSLQWLAHKPIAFVKEWPKNYDAAAIITPEINKKPNNIKNLLPILSSEKVKANFFISPSLADQHKNLVKSLTNYGDVGALINIGYLSSINDTINSLNDYDTQLQQFKNAKNVIQKITKEPVYGIMPYYGLFNENTVGALIKANYKYLMTDSLTDRSVPKSMVRGDSMLVSFTKSARDDYEVIRDLGLTNPSYQFYTYQEDIDRVLFEGGMYVFKPHTAYQCDTAYVNVVKNVIQDLKSKKYWVTTPHEIYKWWKDRHYIETGIERTGKQRVTLTISNPGDEAAKNVVIQVNLNQDAKKIHLSSEIIGTKIAKTKYDDVNHVIYVYIDKMNPGESRTYYIDLINNKQAS